MCKILTGVALFIHFSIRSAYDLFNKLCPFISPLGQNGVCWNHTSIVWINSIFGRCCPSMVTATPNKYEIIFGLYKDLRGVIYKMYWKNEEWSPTCNLLYWHELYLIPVWISNNISCKVWDKHTYLLSNFADNTIEMDVIANPCWG